MRVLLSVLVATACLVSLGVEARDNKKTYTIKWKERNNRIIDATVCFNYKYGSIDSRECRSAALSHFKDQCTKLSLKSTNYGYPHNHTIRPKRDKFCVAKDSFSPVN